MPSLDGIHATRVCPGVHVVACSGLLQLVSWTNDPIFPPLLVQFTSPGKGESDGSEVGDDEEDVDYSTAAAAAGEEDEDEDDEGFDFEDSDEDDEDMLDEYLATKGS